MSRMPLRAAAAAVLVPAVLAGATALPPPSEAASTLAMVALGDSVPSGGACGCEPFPQRYAHQVAARTGHAVTMTDDAYGGATSDDVVHQLDERSVRSSVARARTILVMIGANDFGPAFRRVLAHKERARVAFPPVAARVRANVVTIVRRLRAIDPGADVLVGGYWNVMKDGRVGRAAYGAWGLRQADRATAYADTALRRAVAETHAIFVSTYHPFKGPHGNADPTALLAPDGDHPNARGHRVIARAYFRAAPRG